MLGGFILCLILFIVLFLLNWYFIHILLLFMINLHLRSLCWSGGSGVNLCACVSSGRGPQCLSARTASHSSLYPYCHAFLSLYVCAWVWVHVRMHLSGWMGSYERLVEWGLGLSFLVIPVFILWNTLIGKLHLKSAKKKKISYNWLIWVCAGYHNLQCSCTASVQRWPPSRAGLPQL